MPKTSRYVALALILCQIGCAHFILRSDDPLWSKTAKVATRTTFGVATLGGTEVYVYAAKKDEEIARTYDLEQVAQLQRDKSTAITAYWVAVTIVGVVALVAAASANAKGGGGSTVRQAVIHTQPGTCSWHGGVAGCDGGVAVCADNSYSPGLQSCYVTWE